MNDYRKFRNLTVIVEIRTVEANIYYIYIYRKEESIDGGEIILRDSIDFFFVVKNIIKTKKKNKFGKSVVSLSLDFFDQYVILN